MQNHHKIPSMKQLRLLLLPPGWNASPPQDSQNETTKSIATPSGWDASSPQDTQHEATKSIATPSGWDASPSKGYTSSSISPVPIYSYGWREKMHDNADTILTSNHWPTAFRWKLDWKSDLLTSTSLRLLKFQVSVAAS